MAVKINETVAEVNYDNLIAGPSPAALTFMVDLAESHKAMKRGTLIAEGGDIIKTETTGKPYAILAEDVPEGETEALAYRTGHFIENSLIVGDGYAITAADKDKLRSIGILLSDAVR